MLNSVGLWHFLEGATAQIQHHCGESGGPHAGDFGGTGRAIHTQNRFKSTLDLEEPNITSQPSLILALTRWFRASTSFSIITSNACNFISHLSLWQPPLRLPVVNPIWA